MHSSTSPSQKGWPPSSQRELAPIERDGPPARARTPDRGRIREAASGEEVVAVQGWPPPATPRRRNPPGGTRRPPIARRRPGRTAVGRPSPPSRPSPARRRHSDSGASSRSRITCQRIAGSESSSQSITGSGCRHGGQPSAVHPGPMLVPLPAGSVSWLAGMVTARTWRMHARIPAGSGCQSTPSLPWKCRCPSRRPGTRSPVARSAAPQGPPRARIVPRDRGRGRHARASAACCTALQRRISPSAPSTARGRGGSGDHDTYARERRDVEDAAVVVEAAIGPAPRLLRGTRREWGSGSLVAERRAGP